MLLCVILISYPEQIAGELVNNEEPISQDLYIALGFGLLAPVVMSIFISVSRYWTVNYGYNSLDITMDTVLVLGLSYISIFTHYYQEGVYS